MAVARFWRTVGLRALGGGQLTLSELQLYGSTGRLDAGATLTSSHSPVAGSLAALADDSTATDCTFSAASVGSSGFWISWELIADSEVFGVRPGSGDTNASYIQRLDLQYLDASGRWVTAFSFGQFSWPGARALDVAPALSDPFFTSVAALLPMNGADGSTSFVDVAGGVWTAAAGAKLSTAHSFFGTGVGWFQGSDRITTPHSTAIDLSTGDFTIEFLVRFTTVGVDQVILNKGTNTSTIAYQVWVNSGNAFGFRGFNGGALFNILGGTAAAGTDYFVSARRSGSTFSLHVNNTLIGTAAYAGALLSGPTDPLSVGAYSNGVAGMRGYMGQFRITGGVARAVAVPTTAWPVSSGSAQTFDPLSLVTSGAAAVIAASAAVQSHSAPAALRATVARDVEFGGAGTMYGTTKTKGTPNLPTKARVVLLHQRSKLPVRETWSDPVAGAFVFTGIDTSQQFLALAEDAEGHFRPVAANRLTPEVL